MKIERSRESMLRTFQKKTIEQGDCLVWTGATNSAGYPVIYRGVNENGHSDMGYVARFIWQETFGPIPAERIVRQRGCETAQCVNPAHLELFELNAPKPPKPDRERRTTRTPEQLRASIERRTQSGTVDGCLIWTGAKDSDGYPKINIGREVIDGPRKNRQVHRVNWELTNGPIPDGYELARHADCPNRLCIEPLHLQLNEYKGKAGRVTQNQNIDPNAYRCGHERTPENTYLTGGYGFCKTCAKIRNRERCRRWRGRHPDKVSAYRESRRTQPTGTAA